MALAIDYRPKTLEDVAGNATVKKSLNALLGRNKKDIPKCFAFFGASGCGKTTLARIVATRLGCLSNEFYEMNAASVRGIDTIRDIERQMRYDAMGGGCRIWLLDEIHQYPAASQEALLKMFEDCPPHVYFMICTTNPEKLKPALKGRCITFEVLPITDDEMFDMLVKIVEAEKADVPDEVIEKIISFAGGSSRNAVQLLEKVIDLDVADMNAVAMKMDNDEAVTKDLITALVSKKSWSVVAGIIKRITVEPETIRHGVMGYCTAILLSGKSNAQCALILEEFKGNWYDSGRNGLVSACYNVCL